eukprot:1154408-Pelagomonas_calceolata.AAC.3
MEEMRLIQEEVAVLLEGSWAAFLGALRVAITACTALLAAPRVSGVSPSSRLDSRACMLLAGSGAEWCVRVCVFVD